jgi:hypothetical protein
VICSWSGHRLPVQHSTFDQDFHDFLKIWIVRYYTIWLQHEYTHCHPCRVQLCAPHLPIGVEDLKSDESYIPMWMRSHIGRRVDEKGIPVEKRLQLKIFN